MLPEAETRGYKELLFLQLVREGADLPEGGQAMRGYLSSTTAFYEPGLPVAQVRIDRIEGTLDNTSIQFTEEQYGGGASASAISTYYYGTIEGSRMELTGDLPGARVTWIGEEGTLKDYHDEVEQLVRETQENKSPMPD